MTDNRTTELLCKLLEERGVKYSDFTSAIRNGKAIFKTRWKHERGYAELSEWESTGSNNLFIQNVDPEQAIAATLGSEREAELVRAMEDVLRHSTDTVWVSEIETLVDRMVSLGVYGCEVYEGARPWEVD